MTPMYDGAPFFSAPHPIPVKKTRIPRKMKKRQKKAMRAVTNIFTRYFTDFDSLAYPTYPAALKKLMVAP